TPPRRLEGVSGSSRGGLHGLLRHAHGHLARGGGRTLGQSHGEHAVLHVGADGLCVDGVGEGERPGEAAVHALDAPVGLPFLLLFASALAGDGQDALVDLDLDLVRPEPGQLGAELVGLGLFDDVDGRLEYTTRGLPRHELIVETVQLGERIPAVHHDALLLWRSAQGPRAMVSRRGPNPVGFAGYSGQLGDVHTLTTRVGASTPGPRRAPKKLPRRRRPTRNEIVFRFPPPTRLLKILVGGLALAFVVEAL